MPQLNPARPTTSPAQSVGWRLVTTVMVFGMFAGVAVWRAPVPGVNEPHYLTKARHFWDPDWCGRDLFLQSSNPHWVFYASVGALTRVASLEQTAWIGRILAWGGLAAGWIRLMASLGIGRTGVISAAAIWLSISALGNLSGEWLIGGVESKVFSYAALFFALAAAGERHWRGAAIWSGIAISWHPVVGCWGALAGLVGVGWSISAEAPNGETLRPQLRPTPREWITDGLLGSICALPGLIPALAMLSRAPDAAVQQKADAIHVFDRLNHHLDPHQFPISGWLLYGGLIVTWLLLRRGGADSPGMRFFSRFVVATLAIAAAGGAIGFGPSWAAFLKYYPFRLADCLLPFAVAVAATSAVNRSVALRAQSSPETGRLLSGWIAAILAAIATVVNAQVPVPDRNPSGWTAEQWTAWQEACAWIKRETPPESLFLTPKYNFAFKWYAERAEFVNWKDCPQDATSLVEWKRRLDAVRMWRDKHISTGFSARALAHLRAKTGVDYIVAWRTDPFRRPALYRNRWFAVYPAR